ncbi:Rieske 2Fe-2S domain-containing protein [Alicyclobacillus sp.]|uniref:Rieske (2Fe-2S) protein n=1 Tax=Alicyclobacillus sp. TaxID=61169 RepID=UPI0025C011AC|nr:Rieske 2Fe-2S domain-containing protein [Alicyclobacillus sp.]MCL6517097.1 Rieske 2Fe-2S domain-containing protein [Alicyclobacillus sp.]
MAWTAIGLAADVPLGEMRRFQWEDEFILVYHLEDGWYATSERCTHQDCSLWDEGELEEPEIVCQCHGGAFDIRTGRATRMPCVFPLDVYHVRVNGDLLEIED